MYKYPCMKISYGTREFHGRYYVAEKTFVLIILNIVRKLPKRMRAEGGLSQKDPHMFFALPRFP